MPSAPLPEIPGLSHLQRLGEGGMGTVYRALDERLGRKVAVKILAERLRSDHAFTERFVREARYLARVAHPNLVTIYDASEACLVMELVEGTTLARHLAARGRLPWEEARRLLDSILAAVAAIHAAGLVHRDLKPGNVLMDLEGRPKVMDFGLAKDASEAALTQAGMILGTPEYMSPEQAKGDAVGPATDVYALGAMAYEMLAGRPPFRGGGTATILRMQCEAELPALAPLAPALPDEASAWVERALSKSPASRFKDAGEMRRALAAISEAEGGSTTVVTIARLPASRSRRLSPWIWGGAAALVLLFVSLALRRSGMPRAVLETGGKRLEGRLRSISLLPGGGHRIVLEVGNREESVDLPPGEEGRLTFR